MSHNSDRASQPNAYVPDHIPAYGPGSPAYHRREADLARVRQNQRRSRARKREYVTELENRLRQCEIRGVEASAEVALGARRVTEENRQLRELLHTHGVDDRHIAHYVQSSSGAWEIAPGAIPPIAGASAVQSLEQLLAPRRLSSPDPPPASFTLSSQASRERSAPTPTTSSPKPWETSPRASSAREGSTTSAPIPTRSTDTPTRHSYPSSFATLLTHDYDDEFDTASISTTRHQKYDHPTPSRAFEDDDQDHRYTTPPSRVEEDTKLGCTAPKNTYSGPESFRFLINDD